MVGISGCVLGQGGAMGVDEGTAGVWNTWALRGSFELG